MAIDRMLPLHESSQRLARAVSAMPTGLRRGRLADVPAAGGGRWSRRSAPIGCRTCSTRPLRTWIIAAPPRSSWRPRWSTPCIGRVVALVVLEAAPGTPAWRTSGCTSTPMASSTGPGWSTRRCGCCPTTRISPTTTVIAFATGWSRLPSEAALTTWVAHRCHRTLEPLFAKLHAISRGTIPVAAMWHIVGSTVVAAATQVPLLAGADELAAMRRGQAVLDALVGFGLPVRSNATGRSPEGCRDSRRRRGRDPAYSHAGPPSSGRRHRCVQPEQSPTENIAFDPRRSTISSGWSSPS